MGKLRDKLGRLGAPVRQGEREVAAPAPEDAARTVEERSHASVHRELHREACEKASDTNSADAERRGKLSALRGQMEALGRKLSRSATPGRPAEPCAEQLPGGVDQTHHGALRRLITRHAEDHHHGSIPVALALEACPRDLSILALDPSLAAIDFTRALYIDTETTGLLGGAGTLPFLIGLAWFEGQQLVVEQLLLERPGLEVPMLHRLGEALSQASCIVSYNGKSFDWPLLRTRFILNRVPAPPVPAHLDLLHCARRVYKRRLGAVRLVHLEEAILGFERIEDISGELIPQTYLGYLRGHLPAGSLSPILDHNRSDLVALAAILGELVRRFRAQDARQDARDQLGFASVAARAEHHDAALSFARGAAEADVRGELASEALYLAAELKLRAGDVEGARGAFHEAAEHARASSVDAARAHLALAKLYEHKLKDYERALLHAGKTAEAEGDEASSRRVARLERKLPAVLSLRLG
jgi:uncharacterized protein YprB with RNaseH-like and TPR domain